MLPFEQAEENLTRRYKQKQSLTQIPEIKALRQAEKSIPEVKAALQ